MMCYYLNVQFQGQRIKLVRYSARSKTNKIEISKEKHPNGNI